MQTRAARDAAKIASSVRNLEDLVENGSKNDVAAALAEHHNLLDLNLIRHAGALGISNEEVHAIRNGGGGGDVAVQGGGAKDNPSAAELAAE